MRGGSLRRYTSTQVVDLFTLAMHASITGFILRCFQLRESSSAVLLEVEVEQKPRTHTRYPVTSCTLALIANTNCYMSTIKVMAHYLYHTFCGLSHKASARVAVATTVTVYTAGLAVCKEDGSDSSNTYFFYLKFCERCSYGYRISIIVQLFEPKGGARA